LSQLFKKVIICWCGGICSGIVVTSSGNLFTFHSHICIICIKQQWHSFVKYTDLIFKALCPHYALFKSNFVCLYVMCCPKCIHSVFIVSTRNFTRALACTLGMFQHLNRRDFLIPSAVGRQIRTLVAGDNLWQSSFYTRYDDVTKICVRRLS
jgi:hypothetical protein